MSNQLKWLSFQMLLCILGWLIYPLPVPASRDQKKLFYDIMCDPVLRIDQEKFLGSTSKMNNPLDKLSRIHVLRDIHLRSTLLLCYFGLFMAVVLASFLSGWGFSSTLSVPWLNLPSPRVAANVLVDLVG